MSFRLSASAETDLIEIYLEGAELFGMAQADAYQDRLDTAIHLIADYPNMGRLRSEITPPIRVHPVGVHIIVYAVDADHIAHILRIRHSREDWAPHSRDNV